MCTFKRLEILLVFATQTFAMDRSERKLETGIDILEIDVNEIMIGWVFEWVGLV